MMLLPSAVLRPLQNVSSWHQEKVKSLWLIALMLRLFFEASSGFLLKEGSIDLACVWWLSTFRSSCKLCFGLLRLSNSLSVPFVAFLFFQLKAFREQHEPVGCNFPRTAVPSLTIFFFHHKIRFMLYLYQTTPCFLPQDFPNSGTFFWQLCQHHACAQCMTEPPLHQPFRRLGRPQAVRIRIETNQDLANDRQKTGEERSEATVPGNHLSFCQEFFSVFQVLLMQVDLVTILAFTVHATKVLSRPFLPFSKPWKVGSWTPTMTPQFFSKPKCAQLWQTAQLQFES